MPEDEDWRQHRTEAAATHERELNRRREQESAAAHRLLVEFTDEATRRGITPVPLRARSYDGRYRYRTSTTGWYLRLNESVAVGTDGSFFVLGVPTSLRSLLAGVTLTPSDPPLVLGKGGRDGESIDLPDALALVLDRKG